jgi:hypothetical protein
VLAFLFATYLVLRVSGLTQLALTVAERTITSPHDRAGVEAAMLRLPQVLTTEKRTTQ